MTQITSLHHKNTQHKKVGKRDYELEKINEKTVTVIRPLCIHQSIIM